MEWVSEWVSEWWKENNSAHTERNALQLYQKPEPFFGDTWININKIEKC
jgi:hypothetical protein